MPTRALNGAVIRFLSITAWRPCARAVAAAKSARALSISCPEKAGLLLQALAPLEVLPGQLRLGFSRRQRRLLLAHVELNEQLARFDDIARGEAHLGDRAGHLVSDFELPHGNDRADRARRRGPFSLARSRHGDGFDGFRCCLRGGLRGLEFLALVEPQSAGDRGNDHDDGKPRQKVFEHLNLAE